MAVAAGQARRVAAELVGLSRHHCHVLVAEAPRKMEPARVNRPGHLLTLSARDSHALAELVQTHAERPLSSEEELADVCFTSSTGRAHFPHRLTIQAGSAVEMRERLRTVSAGTEAAGTLRGHVEAGRRPRVAFLFTARARSIPAWAERSTTRSGVPGPAIDECQRG